jgi:hypothetical protein
MNEQMTASVHPRARFLEGGNVATIVAAPIMFAGTLYFYKSLAEVIAPLQINMEDVYTYAFNLYAIEIGALLALFALFACKPTAFLERIKNTATFAAITANTNITLVMAILALVATLLLGLVRFAPDKTITLHSVVFVAWFWLIMTTTSVYVRTIRLVLTALA